ncbi:DUF6415 family natural product biosynthesis protein [Streptomyces hokutonensis]|uniref:DUF6415 family natural product biosynthesis protein n=1 Tax=Streptomyces hokutonensis TaxID=1306990 RepID=UPI0003618DB5|nr:DUF6415 family natural product biosynthesis protein [Streptomyces hokutonensis]
MGQRTARPPTTEEPDRRPLDVQVMRDGARRLLTEDAEPPAADELSTLTARLRGHIVVAVPDVETLAWALPEDDVPRACALACCGEARMRLRLGDGGTLAVRVASARRLARSVLALCDHYENLGGGESRGNAG